MRMKRAEVVRSMENIIRKGERCKFHKGDGFCKIEIPSKVFNIDGFGDILIKKVKWRRLGSYERNGHRYLLFRLEIWASGKRVAAKKG